MSKRYLTPLPRVLASSLQSALNMLIQQDDQASKKLLPLRDRTLAVSISSLAIDLFFTVEHHALLVKLQHQGTPDTQISGSLPALAGMGAKRPNTPATRPGAVQIQGDAELARAYQQFFQQLDPDWEEAIAQRFGDVIGHRINQLIRALRQGFQQAIQNGMEMTGDYLREESGLLVTRTELENFYEAVDEVRDDVDRLAAQVKQLRIHAL